MGEHYWSPVIEERDIKATDNQQPFEMLFSARFTANVFYSLIIFA